MTTTTLTLTGFLLARIAEDEATARYERADLIDRPEPYSTLAGAWPERVLAECEAKRQAVELYAPGGVFDDLRLMKILAAVYADHPDYHDEWRLP